MAAQVCPHCGAEVVGAKIKCRVCGNMLTSPTPSPDGHMGGLEVVARGEERRDALKRGSAGRAELAIDTKGRHAVDITEQVWGFARAIGEAGFIHIFVPHATAGIALIETGSGSEADLGATLDRLFPPDDRYVHRHGSTGHGRSHIVPAFVAPSTLIPCDHGDLLLGTWQRVVLVDPNEDNNMRRVMLGFIPGRSADAPGGTDQG